jgi:multiple sugar transport system ATP-binding protein
MAHLEVRKISRHFASLEALKDISFSVDEGEFFCLLGASSAGKTTTLRAIAGLEKLTSGQVIFEDRDLTSAAVQGRGMSMIFQTFALYPHLSIRDNLSYPLRRDGVAKAQIRQRVSEVAELLRVAHTLDRKPGTLSGGEQQRVAIGRAIVRRPRLLLLDEPLTNLDAKLRHDMRAEFKRLHRELGMTMIYATPDQLEALTMGERIALIDDGTIVETGEPRSLYAKPSHTFVASMVGAPAINLIEGKIRDSALNLPFGQLELADTGCSSTLSTGVSVTAGIRPHDLHILDGADTPGRSLAIKGKVRLTEPLGDVTILDIDVGDLVLKMVLPEEKATSYSLGQSINLSFQLSDTHLFMTETGTRIN